MLRIQLAHNIVAFQAESDGDKLLVEIAINLKSNKVIVSKV